MPNPGKNRGIDGSPRDLTDNREERQSSVPNDLPDNQHDRERLEERETFINLPDVKDIPGQEFVNAQPLGSLGDTTISSADEEGEDIFDDDEEDTGTNFNVTAEERKALEDVEYLPTTDEDNLRRARMDNTDFQGEKLNEDSFGVGQSQSGDDLDMPVENDEEDIKEGMADDDEENKYFSLGSSENDNVTEGTP